MQNSVDKYMAALLADASELYPPRTALAAARELMAVLPEDEGRIITFFFSVLVDQPFPLWRVAAEQLASIGITHPLVQTGWERLMQAADSHSKVRALWILEFVKNDDDFCGEPFISILHNTLDDPDKEVRYFASACFADCLTEARLHEWLEVYLAKDMGPVARQAYEAIFEELGARATLTLKTLIRDQRPKMRTLALSMLLHTDVGAHFEACLELMHDPDVETRSVAASQMRVLRNSEGCNALLRAIADPAAEVRAEAITSLGYYEAQHAIPALQQALDDEAADVRRAAVWALGYLKDGASVPLITHLLQDPVPAVREAAEFALKQLA